MINWIFDLDYTLYQYSLSPQEKFNYDKLEYDPQLKLKIKMLPGKKLMFTNANVWHTLKCVKHMKIERAFHKVICRELSGFKPDPSSFVNFIHFTKINQNQISFFFEDTIPNLIMAKQLLGWRTVYIGNHPEDLKYAQNNPQIINFIFPNITEALYYFHHNLPNII